MHLSCVALRVIVMPVPQMRSEILFPHPGQSQASGPARKGFPSPECASALLQVWFKWKPSLV